MTEEKAVEFLNNIEDRAILTELEVKLSNELLKTIEELKKIKALLEEGVK